MRFLWDVASWTTLLLNSDIPNSNQDSLSSRPISQSQSIDSFIATQAPIAWDRLLCNIGPNACAREASRGVVVASPSKHDPPYFYTWTRDSALVLKLIIDSLPGNSSDLRAIVEDYTVAQARLQGMPCLSGPPDDGSSLGEPKFTVDLCPFPEPWGRPQRDGPALRAVALMGHARRLASEGKLSEAVEDVWPVVRKDLGYVVKYWNETGFDLWEEVRGSSFFTTLVQYRALKEGAAVAALLGQSCEACLETAPHILCFLQNFWSEPGGFVVSNINVETDRTGKDINSILASIHTFDPALGCDDPTFQPCSGRALANHKAVVDSFRALYPINAETETPSGRAAAAAAAAAVGRYAEDVYYGGNPWYLATLAAAEQLYDALMVWRAQGFISVTDLSRGFFRDLVPSASVGEFDETSSVYGELYEAVSSYADGFLGVVARYAGENGSLSEQFGKDDGEPLSARDLTWSYAAFLTAADRRAGIAPPSWAGSTAETPATCSATTARAYDEQSVFDHHAIAPHANDKEPSWATCSALPWTAVEFRELVETAWGETVKIVGSDEKLGSWDPSRAVQLDAADYTPNEPLWRRVVWLQANEVIEYKYIKVWSGTVAWEDDPNHTLTVPQAGTTATRADAWQTAAA